MRVFLYSVGEVIHTYMGRIALHSSATVKVTTDIGLGLSNFGLTFLNKMGQIQVICEKNNRCGVHWMIYLFLFVFVCGNFTQYG